ncbi:MAG: hypothetical protein R2867_25600 [Caldilineaceae bacterium]
MTKPALRVKEIERITLRVPFTPRTQKWNKLLVWQWQIVEVIRATTDDGTVGYGETLPHYTWGTVPETAIALAKGRNPIELLGDDSLGAGLQMALYDVVGRALAVPVHRLLNLPKVRDWSPLAWWNTKTGPEDLAAEAQDAVAQGTSITNSKHAHLSTSLNRWQRSVQSHPALSARYRLEQPIARCGHRDAGAAKARNF